MSILCIDLGASFLKFGEFNEDLKLMRVERFPCPPFHSDQGPAREISIQKIFQVVDQALQGWEPGNSTKRWQGLLVSNQMQGFVLYSPKKQSLVSDFISWQDQRCLSRWDQLTETLEAQDLQAIGQELKPGHALSTWFALKADLAGLTPLSLGDALVLHLTGFVPKVHFTNASGFGCFDLKSKSWSESILKKTALTDLQMPLLTGNLDCVGESKYGPVYTAVGDQQAALYGMDLAPNQLSINVATGSQVSTVTSTLALDPQHQTRPYFEGQFLKTITHLPAGRAVNFLLSQLTKTQSEDTSDLFGQVALPDGFQTDLQVNLNFFPTSFGHGGSIANLRESNFSTQHILAASLKTMAANYKLASEKLNLGKTSTFALVGSGGFLRKSKYLQAEISKVFGLPLKISPDHEDALIGLAKLWKRSSAVPK